MKTYDKHTYVFLYYTESISNDGDDEVDKGGLEPQGNRLYRCELESGKQVKIVVDDNI
jgi:hypothetical protein